MISFVGAFFLVRYRVHEAAEQKHKVDEKAGDTTGTVGSGSMLPAQGSTNTTTASHPSNGPAVFAANPRFENIGPFRTNKPPVHLLEHCHTLSMVLAVAGFIPALIGVLCYVWARLPRSSRIVATVAMGISVVGALGIIILPPPAEQSGRGGSRA